MQNTFLVWQAISISLIHIIYALASAVAYPQCWLYQWMLRKSQPSNTDLEPGGFWIFVCWMSSYGHMVVLTKGNESGIESRLKVTNGHWVFNIAPDYCLQTLERKLINFAIPVPLVNGTLPTLLQCRPVCCQQVSLLTLSTIILPLEFDCMPEEEAPAFLILYIIKYILPEITGRQSDVVTIWLFCEGTENRRVWVLCPHHFPTLKSYLSCLTLGFLKPFPMSKFLCSIDLQFRYGLHRKRIQWFAKKLISFETKKQIKK